MLLCKCKMLLAGLAWLAPQTQNRSKPPSPPLISKSRSALVAEEAFKKVTGTWCMFCAPLLERYL